MYDIFHVNIWVTHNCNFRCRYCYEKGNYKEKELIHDTANGIIDFISYNIKTNQNLMINFHGGEPTLNFDIIKYIVLKIEKMIENNTHFSLTTNGSILDNDMIDFLCKHFKKNISISIDGKKETHEFNRKCISDSIPYELILENAIKLLKRNINVRIRMTYDKKNVQNLSENIIFFLENGFKQIAPMPDSYSKEWVEEDFEIIKNEYSKLRSYLKQKKIDDVDIFELSNCFDILGKCNGGKEHYSIDVDGSIYPCTFVNGLLQFKIGDVFNGIKEDKIKEIDIINHMIIDSCKECSLYEYCNSTRCILLNYVTEGDFKKPNLVECNRMNIRMELL